VDLRYRPPGLAIGLTMMAFAAAACGALWIRPVLRAEARA
jgi:hypothetical protein